jgi:hypothetical protein
MQFAFHFLAAICRGGCLLYSLHKHFKSNTLLILKPCQDYGGKANPSLAIRRGLIELHQRHGSQVPNKRAESSQQLLTRASARLTCQVCRNWSTIQATHSCMTCGQAYSGGHLAGLGLQQLPQEIRDLQHFRSINQPLGKFTSSATTSNDLQLFLGNNQLAQLPSILFELRNLSVLSLRTNLLTEIPQVWQPACRRGFPLFPQKSRE